MWVLKQLFVQENFKNKYFCKELEIVHTHIFEKEPNKNHKVEKYNNQLLISKSNNCMDKFDRYSIYIKEKISQRKDIFEGNFHNEKQKIKTGQK